MLLLGTKLLRETSAHVVFEVVGAVAFAVHEIIPVLNTYWSEKCGWTNKNILKSKEKPNSKGQLDWYADKQIEARNYGNKLRTWDMGREIDLDRLKTLRHLCISPCF